MGRLRWSLADTIFLCVEAKKCICSESWGCMEYYLKTTYLVKVLQSRHEKIQALESKTVCSEPHSIEKAVLGRGTPISQLLNWFLSMTPTLAGLGKILCQNPSGPA